MKTTSFLCLFILALAGCSGTGRLGADGGAWIPLFDGTSLDGWQMSGPGAFALQPDGSMLSQGGMGLFYYAARPFRDYVLELEWKVETDSTNSGVFLRFPDAPDPWYAVNTGYEVQIDDSQDPLHQTGAIYSFSAPFRSHSKPAGQWNTYRIKVSGQRYEVFLNGVLVNDFVGHRSREGFIGVQNHDDHSKAWFRNIRVQPLPDGGPERLADLFAVDPATEPIRVLMVTATHGFRHGPAIDTARAVMKALEATTEFRFDLTEDLTRLNDDTLAQYDLLFFANSTLRGGDDGVEATAADDGNEAPWRVYQTSLNTPDGTLNAEVTLTGTPEAGLGGTIRFENTPAPAPLRDAAFDGTTLTFNFDGGQQYGRIDVKTTLQRDQWTGTLSVGGAAMAFNGTLTAAAAEAREKETVTAAQRRAIMNFLRAGKGIVGAHSALDAFYHWNEYRAMVGGGLFQEHPWTQSVRVVVEEPDNPAVAHFGDGFWIRDEIYVLDENPRWNARVLASLDMQSVGVEQGPADMGRNDYPISWIRNHNGGRVFYTKLGHFSDVWTTPAFLTHFLQGMRMAAGRLPADFSGHRVKETVAAGVWPDDIAIDDRGNVWIAELRGKVHRYDAAAHETRLVAQVPTTDPTKIEHGLYGIEVDPHFYDGAPYVYLYYAERETFINTLSRFEYRNDEIDLSTEQVLLRVPTEPQCCHQAGDLEWGPDGTLYLSTGDTGMSETRPDWEVSAEALEAFKKRHDLKDLHWSRLVDSERSAQNLQDLRGKILRINPDGTIPKDNPFFGQPGIRWEIYAYGLRNPYRFKVDPQTGTLYIAVVGPDAQFDYDEYNIATHGGENFGWPRTLGRLFYNEWTPEQIPNYVPPMWEYTYETGGRSATVGPIYRHEGPGSFPAVFQNKIFLFDWSRRWIKWADVAEGRFTNDLKGSVKNHPPHVDLPARRYVNIKTFDLLKNTSPISMELGPDGSIYVAEFDGFWDAGPNANVSRYRWISGNEPPIGEALGVPSETNPFEIHFDGSRSYDPNADRLTYRWDFGDGATSDERQPVHTYRRAGAYTARLTVTDPDGLSGVVTVPVQVPAAPAGTR